MFKKIVVTTVAAMAMTLSAQGIMAKQVFRVGMGDAIDSDQGAMAKQFESLVESLSGGEIEVELFPNGALGTETEMLQNTRRGTLDMAFIGLGNAVPFVPELATLTMPYLIENHYDAIQATTGSLGAHWNTLATDKGGFQMLGWTYSNFRYITNSKRPVAKLADVKGLKIRIPQNKVLMATLKAWDANPVPMAWSETFTALQQGVVDGQENPYIVNYTMKFHEVQKYVTEVHYQYSLQPLIVGTKSWEKFDEKTRAILTRAGIEAQQYCIAFQILEAGKAKQGMIDAGVQVDTLSDEAEWKKLAIEKVWPENYDFIGGKQNLDLVLNALGKK
jgi:tripartite ATP-independent transporter DctP family solute receptor